MAASYSADTPHVADNVYDLVVVTSSWDVRCLSLLDSSIDAFECALVLFSEIDEGGLRTKHDRQLIQKLRNRDIKIRKIRGSALQLEDVWESLLQVVQRVVTEKGEPISILVDITTCPRFLSIGLLAATLQFGAIEKISLFYSEGVYPEGGDRGEVVFKRGRWNTVPCPFLYGEFDPGKYDHYVVSIGFEGGKTMRVLNRADPRRVAVLVPDPGTQPGYTERTLHNNRVLIDEYIRPSGKEIIRAPAADAVAAWQALSQAALEIPTDENVFFLCNGTKPHSIGLALRAIESEHAAVLYNIPERHEVVPITPAGKYWVVNARSVATPLTSSQFSRI